jgi:ATP-dependent exoDNAse (exonuclease V) beta subunit
LAVLGGEENCPDCDENMLFQGAMDLVAVREDGVEIVDYKYSGKGAKKLAETYAPQLRLYRIATAKALKIPEKNIRCTLVNINLGYEVEV